MTINAVSKCEVAHQSGYWPLYPPGRGVLQEAGWQAQWIWVREEYGEKRKLEGISSLQHLSFLR